MYHCVLIRLTTCYHGTQRSSQSPSSERFVWLSLIEIRQSQDLAITTQMSLQFDAERKILVNDESLVWIRDNSELRSQICIVGHSGAPGHREVDTTITYTKSFCLWPDMEQNVQAFCFPWLHRHVNDNRVTLRLVGEALYGTTCNEFLHFEFISMHPLKSPHCGGFVPMTLFTGWPASSHLQAIFDSTENNSSIGSKRNVSCPTYNLDSWQESPP